MSCRARLTLIATILLVSGLTILAVFLWPDRDNIARGVIQWGTIVGIILIVGLVLAALTGIGTLFLHAGQHAMNLADRIIDIRHKHVLTQSEQVNMFLRQRSVVHAEVNIMDIEMPGMKVSSPRLASPSRQKQLAMPKESLYDEPDEEDEEENEGGRDDIPTHVRYEDIRGQVPRGHVLVGVGHAGIDTKDEGVGACVWIVGLSGTGKTSTTVVRVEERYQKGHQFLGADPHWFKPDSLTNALLPYADSFLMPMAKSTEETFDVLRFFLDEFKGRKEGRIPQPWQKITLLIDETNALMDAQTEEEKEIADLLKIIARICGQEARNFLMGGMFISQQATGLAWLRKVALMVIVHQLLMESEKKLACNGDSQVIEEMKKWPVGRTYVYGVGFQDGPRTVQQPYFKPQIAGPRSPGRIHNPSEGTESSRYQTREHMPRRTADIPYSSPIVESTATPLPLQQAFHSVEKEQRQQDLLAVYKAYKQLGTTNRRVIADHVKMSTGKVQDLLRELETRGYVQN